MFKMFAIMCVLVWPDDVMTSQLECNQYWEENDQVYATREICDEAAEKKFYATMEGFRQLEAPFERIIIGCDQTE